MVGMWIAESIEKLMRSGMRQRSWEELVGQQDVRNSM